MSDCHYSSLDVSNNLSGYFISNSVLVTSCNSMGGSSACGSHRQHWTVKSSLCALAVLSGGGPFAFGIHMFLYALVFSYIFLLDDHFLIFSYKLTILNGFSLMVWKCIAVTFSSSSFKWGDISQSRYVCQIWAHFKFCSCFTELFHFYK